MKLTTVSGAAAAALALLVAFGANAEPRTNDASALRGATASVSVQKPGRKSAASEAKRDKTTDATKKSKKEVATSDARTPRASDAASLRGAGATASSSMSATTAYAPTGGSSRLVSVANSYVGRNPTGRSMLWCMTFVRMAMDKAGYKTINSNHSSAAFKYGPKVSRSQARPGDLVYHARRGGGHVEIFAGWANAEKTKYTAITGNSCGPRGKRYVCKITRPVSRMQAVIRPAQS